VQLEQMLPANHQQQLNGCFIKTALGCVICYNFMVCEEVVKVDGKDL
jgi:hypothetical protein